MENFTLQFLMVLEESVAIFLDLQETNQSNKKGESLVVVVLGLDHGVRTGGFELCKNRFMLRCVLVFVLCIHFSVTH